MLVYRRVAVFHRTTLTGVLLTGSCVKLGWWRVRWRGRQVDGFWWLMNGGYWGLTPPKFNIAPEEWWLENEFPFGIGYFRGYVKFQGCTYWNVPPNRVRTPQKPIYLRPGLGAPCHPIGSKRPPIVGLMNISGCESSHMTCLGKKEFHHFYCPLRFL